MDFMEKAVLRFFSQKWSLDKKSLVYWKSFWQYFAAWSVLFHCCVIWGIWQALFEPLFPWLPYFVELVSKYEVIFYKVASLPNEPWYVEDITKIID